MPTRRRIKSVLHGFLGTVVSRHSKSNGYWLFGVFEHTLAGRRINLLGVGNTPETSGANSVNGELGPEDFDGVAQLARRKFAEQVYRHGFEMDILASAEWVIARCAPALETHASGFLRRGSYFVFRATVGIDQRAYQRQTVVFVAPHEPTLEMQRGSAKN